MVRKRHAGAVVGLMVGVAIFAGAPPASAACHAFTVTVTPSNPAEGSTVTATISRDGAVRPSSVRVTSVDGTAHAGQDYVVVDQRVEFSSETSTTITVSTTQDTLDEPDETFSLRLTEGGGCEVNPNFQYGSPATITIRDDDPASTTPPTTHATSTTATSVAVVPSTARLTTTVAVDNAPSVPSTVAPGSTSEVASGSSSSTSIATEAASTSNRGGSSAWPAVIGSLVLLGAAGGGVALALRRRRAG